MRPIIRPSVVFSLTCACLGASGCSSSGAVNGFLNGIGELLGLPNEAQEVSAYMQEWYWWRDEAPKVDVSAMDTAEEALEALRYQPKDRYSYVESAATYNSFFRTGTTVAFGISYLAEPGALVIRSVQANSPAATAGLKRGDRITAIDAVTVTQLQSDGTLNAAFGEISVGVSRVFTVTSVGAAPRDLLVSKAEFNLQHAHAKQLSTPAGVQAGYVYLGAFTDQTRTQWRDALQPLVANATQHFVVDLRYNGGGTLMAAVQVGSSLAPPAADNQLFTKLSYNRYHINSNYEFKFNPSERMTSPVRLAFIVDAGTCSASEALVQALKPFAQIALIGNATCGKPVGFTPQLIADGEKVLNAVDFELSNAAGETDYFAGLTPTCRASDDLTKPLGDASEAMTAVALYWLETGVCPVAAASSGMASKSDANAPTLRRYAPRSTAEYFGLY